MNSKSTLMTEGPIYKQIAKFAFPILCGNIFQQLYNMVDSLVIGNFVGKESLAAISSTSSLIFLLVGLFTGIFSGAGVVISRYFGAGDTKKVQASVHTSVAFGIISGVVMTIIGTLFAPQILKLMGTPDAVFDKAIIYVRIYF